jgi:hypothetical protein
MRFLLLLLPLSANAQSYVLNLSQFDQEKLASLVERLPESSRNIEVTDLSHPRIGIGVTSHFPIDDQGFKFQCVSNYFNLSPVASSAFCHVSLDIYHPNVTLGYDEYQIELKDGHVSRALYDAISYGRPFKEFRSEQREEGIGFDGKKKSIFRYLFKCLPESCILRISAIGGVQI